MPANPSQLSPVSQRSDTPAIHGTLRRQRSQGNHEQGDMKAVLLVDDSPMVVERVREAIGEIAHLSIADAVHREHTAVEALEHGGIDIVVLDLHLDWGTGFGVLRALQAIDMPRPRVVVFTTYDLPEYRRQAMALGADHFLDKARDFDRLIEILQGYAESSGSPTLVQ